MNNTISISQYLLPQRNRNADSPKYPQTSPQQTPVISTTRPKKLTQRNTKSKDTPRHVKSITRKPKRYNNKPHNIPINPPEAQEATNENSALAILSKLLTRFQSAVRSQGMVSLTLTPNEERVDGGGVPLMQYIHCTPPKRQEHLRKLCYA